MPSERMDHSPKPDVDLNESSLSFLSSLSSGKDEDSMLLSDQLNINILNSLTSSNLVNAETLESTFDLNSEKDNSKTSSGMMTSVSENEQSSILNDYLKVSESLSSSSSIPTSGNFVFQTPSVKNVDLSTFSTCKIASTATNKQGTQVLILQKPSTNLSSMMMQTKHFPVASGSNATIASSVIGATSNTPKILTVPTLSTGSNIINPVASATTMKGGDVKFFINQVPGSSNFATVKQIGGSNSSTVQIPLKRSVTQSSTGQVITKVIFTNNASSNQSLSTPVSISGSSTAVSTQPQSILLTSPTKTYTLSRSVGGSQQILRTLPGTPTKQGMFVLSPVKSVQKITNVPITFSKSPRRIAPATNAVISTLNSGSRVATVVCPTSSVAATSVPAVKNFSVQSPTKVILKSVTPQTVFKPVIGSTAGTRTSTNFSTVVSSVVQQTTQSPATQSIQVPGSKFHYVRLVSAPTTSTTNTVDKQPTLIQASNASGLAGNLVSNTTHPTVSTLSTSSQVRSMVPIAPAKLVAPKQVSQRILIPAGGGSQIRATSAGQLSQLSTGTLIPVGNNSQSYVMVPAQYVTQLQQSSQSGSQVIIQHPNILPAPTTAATTSSAGCFANHPSYISITTSNTHTTSSSAAQQQSSCSSNPAAIVPSQAKLANGRAPPPPEVDNRPRKPCNCTKSQCLKLYCDCFANGEFCNNCNCNNCYNNLLHEEERQKAIKACLDRNPLAFHPKIGKTREGDQERRHTKGCNCKRSGCLKNYCECYEAKILCTNLCKCIGCKNFEDSSERKTLMHLADAAEVRVQQQAAAKTNLSSQILNMPMKPPMMSRTGERLPFAFVTDEVLEATCMCLMAQGEEAERSNTTEEEMEKLILQEFGRCLVQIIDSANKTKVSKMDVQ